MRQIDPHRFGGPVPYQILVRTGNPGVSGPNQFTFPATGNYTIDWGDGVVENLSDEQTHTYPAPGDYVVKVTGGLSAVTFNYGGDSAKLLEIQDWGDIVWVSGAYAYAGCYELNSVASLTALTALTDSTEMFTFCYNLTGTPDLTSLTALTDATGMFQGCFSLTGMPDLTSLTALTNATGMFSGCASLTGTPDLTSLTALTNGQQMFASCSGLTGAPDLTQLTSLANGSGMFQSCSGLTGLVLTGASFPACTNWTNTITATNLPAATVDEWLEVIRDTGPTIGAGRAIRYQLMGAGAHLDANRSPAALTAISNLIGTGWVRSGTY